MRKQPRRLSAQTWFRAAPGWDKPLPTKVIRHNDKFVWTDTPTGTHGWHQKPMPRHDRSNNSGIFPTEGECLDFIRSRDA